MNYLQNIKEINYVNGNVRAWLLDRMADEEYRREVEYTLRPRCEKCGVKESITYFPKYHSNLTDGLCESCLEKYNI